MNGKDPSPERFLGVSHRELVIGFGMTAGVAMGGCGWPSHSPVISIPLLAGEKSLSQRMSLSWSTQHHQRYFLWNRSRGGHSRISLLRNSHLGLILVIRASFLALRHFLISFSLAICIIPVLYYFLINSLIARRMYLKLPIRYLFHIFRGSCSNLNNHSRPLSCIHREKMLNTKLSISYIFY